MEQGSENIRDPEYHQSNNNGTRRYGVTVPRMVFRYKYAHDYTRGPKHAYYWPTMVPYHVSLRAEMEKTDILDDTG